ncbi:LUD domain-containing protein [Halopenitus sp. POP-27]|uniref:LUD domain-containing protein n=1 Tax=Halopenitus sp. POP-27 TaxID=2994425 RepID=UPI0024686B86|nr:LUD domain-containing protein [Halopenitus sp. POP-27]
MSDAEQSTGTTRGRSSSRAEKAARIRELLATEGEQIHGNVSVFNEGRYRRYAELDETEEYRAASRRIKEESIDRLPELIEEVTATVEANGGVVHLAEDASEANRILNEIVADAGAETVVKGKSMTTEEIEMNEALADAGVDTYETDLAEYVLQLADESPSHIASPAIHKSKAEIADLFEETFDPEAPPETAEELTAFASDQLADRIAEADVGITGANFITADTGTLALVTNEGNARKCIVTPDTHVAVAGVEKLVPSMEDLSPFFNLIGAAGAGQDVTAYLSLFTPPVETPAIDFDHPDTEGFGETTDREFHLVLLDNGRMAMREDEDLRETLYCVRCGACANSCANFQEVGGHAFGGETYSGGIATGWEAGVHGMDSAAEFNDLCTGCSRCVDACPVNIDIPWINTVVRDRLNEGADPSRFDHLVDGLTPDSESAGLDYGKRLFGNFETLAKVGSRTAPVSNLVASSSIARRVLERTAGVDRRRELPRFARSTFSSWFEARDDATIEDPTRRVALYPDVYTEYIDPDRGKAAVRVLEALDVDVTIPEVGGSGRAPLSQGMVATASESAEAVAEALTGPIASGRDVVVIEPSDLAMFTREYERLLSEESFERLAGNSYEVLEYVYGLLEHGADRNAIAGPETAVAVPPHSGTAIAYHSHCQQRTLDLEPYTVAVLDEVGYDVVTSDVECCGMAGSFGYKSEYYELSVAVGDRLREQFRTDECVDRTVAASGTSCGDQLDSLLDRDAKHPVQLLDPGT